MRQSEALQAHNTAGVQGTLKHVSRHICVVAQLNVLGMDLNAV
jgi:hypothetical protein